MIGFWRTGAIGVAVLATIASGPQATAAQVGDAVPPRPDPARRAARDVDDIALLLALRPEQRPALAAFLQSMAPPPRGPLRGDRGPAPDESAPLSDGFTRHLDRMTQDLARRSAEDARRIAVARTFYDGLDPTQRRAFEALMRLRPAPGLQGPGLQGPGPQGPGPHPPMDRGGPPFPDRMPPPPPR